jgi:valyl-tRNA synthetase
VTAALHLGHALNNTIQDILTRWHRMLGNNTCWLPGTDHAGIATQTVVEKRVLAEEGKRRTDFQRDEFVSKIQAWKDEYEQRITDQLKAMGCSCDWQRQAFTMDAPRAKAVREAFFQLFKDGLIYRGKRLVNWDPVTQTALADDEVENEEVDGHFYYLRYPLTDGSGHVTVATTRPETMLGDTAVAINPKDPRAAGLKGKRRTDFQREEFVKLIQAWKDEYEARITEQLKTMGCSCDWDRQAFTMDAPRAKAVREAFFRLFKDGLIYRGKRLVNWDPATQTALADDEVEMEEIDGHFYYLRYPL